MIGQTISHFKILEKLGEEGMGVVYKAQDLNLDRYVALKFLPPHLTENEEAKKRFIHEAKAASALDHPNIWTVYEIDKTPAGQMFIAMAYYEGESLKERLDRGAVDVDEALDIASQIAEFLEGTAVGVTVDVDGNVYVADKGNSRVSWHGAPSKKSTSFLAGARSRFASGRSL